MALSTLKGKAKAQPSISSDSLLERATEDFGSCLEDDTFKKAFLTLVKKSKNKTARNALYGLLGVIDDDNLKVIPPVRLLLFVFVF
jgi:hypothetical protein